MPHLRPFALALAVLSLGACASTPPPRPAPPPPPTAEPEPEREPPPRVYRLAPRFADNQGRLPWPATGTITGYFGDRRDPGTGTTTSSVGIDIVSAPGGDVIAVFGGTVERVGVMAAFGTFVMVSHGGWTSVYGNLSATSVEKGDRVEVGQRLGAAGTLQQRRGSGLFFALFQGEEAVDPIPWLEPVD